MKRILVCLVLALSPVAAFAHHPGERIDEVMVEREPAFEPTDLRSTPRLRGRDAEGGSLRLDAMRDRIVVVSFAPESCGAPCGAQQALLREVQAGVNVTPMREMVTFLTVGPAEARGRDDTNWRPVAVGSAAADAAARFAALSERETDAPMIHVIDRGGRHAAIFHGTDFSPVNLILYINELTNAPPPPDPGLLDRILGAFQ